MSMCTPGKSLEITQTKITPTPLICWVLMSWWNIGTIKLGSQVHLLVIIANFPLRVLHVFGIIRPGSKEYNSGIFNLLEAHVLIKYWHQWTLLLHLLMTASSPLIGECLGESHKTRFKRIKLQHIWSIWRIMSWNIITIDLAHLSSYSQFSTQGYYMSCKS